MHEFFKDHKIKVYCRDFITFLTTHSDYNDDSVEIQRSLPISELSMISETRQGIRIDVKSGTEIKSYYINGASMKEASYAISESQNFVLRKSPWKND